MHQLGFQHARLRHKSGLLLPFSKSPHFHNNNNLDLPWFLHVYEVRYLRAGLQENRQQAPIWLVVVSLYKTIPMMDMAYAYPTFQLS